MNLLDVSVIARNNREPDVAKDCQVQFELNGCEVVGTLELTDARSSTDKVSEAARSAVRQYQREGVAAFRRLDGAFGLVIVDRRSRELLLVRDHLGVRHLFYQLSGDKMVVSDDLDSFRQTELDREFIAEFIAQEGICNERTVWSGVSPVPAGSTIRWRSGQLEALTFWKPSPTGAGKHLSLTDAAEQFHSHLCSAVRRQIEPDGRTWAHLSGGLDSSSVVVSACADDPGALGGTLTFVDSLGGNDYEFAQLVAKACAIPHVVVANDEYWAWRDDGEPPPLTDQPTRNYPFYAKFRTAHRQIANRGATSLLTGVGPDLYFLASPGHVPDLIWQRQFATAWKELLKWTVATRSSLWRTALRQALLPLLNPRIQDWGGAGKFIAEDWLCRTFVREYDLRAKLTRRPVKFARGRQYDNEVEWYISFTAAALSSAWNFAPQVRLKHPLMDVSLMEFVLSLPWQLRTNIFHTKAVLRESMRGVLPESLRKRATKGTILTPRIRWSFAKERVAIEKLLKASVLAELGIINPRRILQCVDEAAKGARKDVGPLFAALSLETWLTRKLASEVRVCGE